MADFYKVLKADPMGDPWTPNKPGAKAIQTYWCQVEGQEKAVRIGKQVREDGQPSLAPGQHVYGDLLYAKSQKGTEYWNFKSAQVPEDVQRPADSPAQATAQAATGAQGYAENWAKENTSGMVPGWFIPYGNMIEFIFKEMKKMETEEEPFADTHAINDAVIDAGQDQGTQEEPIDPETLKTLDEIFAPADPEDKDA